MTRTAATSRLPASIRTLLIRQREMLRQVDAGLATARGLALFFGLLSLAATAGTALGGAASQNGWWIDLRFLPRIPAALFAVSAAVLLLGWGLVPRASVRRSRATYAAAALMAAAALYNVLEFYQALGSRAMAPLVPVPSSALVAAAFGWVAWRALAHVGSRESRRTGNIASAAALLSLVIAFPVVQMSLFGTTDYRRPADAAVVLGAKVHPSGELSRSLEDRVQTGVRLYREGLVPTLVMSGAVGASGIDEAAAMRDRAVALGVPTHDIILDSRGGTTDATVTNTTALFRRKGIGRVLAVSQFYHLPRIKLAYRAAGLDVQTVPATGPLYIVETPWLVLREIPGFWTYWLRALVRSLRG